MKPSAKLADKDKGDDQQDSLCDHMEEDAENQHQPQRTQGEKKAVDAVLIEFHVTSRNGSCLQEPFCSDGGGPLDHLSLLNRRRVSGALGWWIMPEDAVLAPTKSIAEKKNAAAAANLVINDFAFVMFENLRFHFLILYYISFQIATPFYPMVIF